MAGKAWQQEAAGHIAPSVREQRGTSWYSAHFLHGPWDDVTYFRMECPTSVNLIYKVTDVLEACFHGDTKSHQVDPRTPVPPELLPRTS